MAADAKSVASMISDSKPGLKREDCKHTKHDSIFCGWKILIGPSDWEDHLQKNEGAERYRIHNLPNCSSCTGLYEIGIVLCPHSARGAGKLDPDCIIPVYIGRADNIRTRLQSYGRDGAHLENGHSNGCRIECKNGCNQKEPGLFRDIFSRGYSIAYRWAPMNNKRDAEKMEDRLLDKFDYAWNKGSNGARRPNDIRQNLDRESAKAAKFSRLAKKLQIFHQNQGVRIKDRSPLLLENGSSIYPHQLCHDLLPQIIGFDRLRPRLLVSMRYGINGDLSSICGVTLDHGSFCMRPPIEGRKRCAQHKGMKINGLTPKLITEGQSPADEEHSSKSSAIEERHHYLHGPILEGKPRCNSYERNCSGTGKASTTQSQLSPESGDFGNDYSIICGVDLENGTFCTRRPFMGRKRCEEHKGMKVKDPISVIKDPILSPVQIRTVFDACNYPKQKNTSAPTCGAPNLDGSFCRRKPTEGNKRCWQHTTNKVKDPFSVPSSVQIPTLFDARDYQKQENTSASTCGALNLDGSFCRRKPTEGNKRCWQHTTKRGGTSSGSSVCSVWMDTSPPYICYSNFSSTCGAVTRKGTYCTRTPARGRSRCWQH